MAFCVSFWIRGETDELSFEVLAWKRGCNENCLVLAPAIGAKIVGAIGLDFFWPDVAFASVANDVVDEICRRMTLRNWNEQLVLGEFGGSPNRLEQLLHSFDYLWSQTLDVDGAHFVAFAFNLAAPVNWVWIVLVGVFRLILETLIFLAVNRYLNPSRDTRVFMYLLKHEVLDSHYFGLRCP